MAFGNKINKLHQIKFDLFKAQNPETGLFDVAFEVEGKLLYAHKPMLNLVSPTFASMLSDRWTTKDEPIKIKVYGYDNFYQFITFLYSAQCELTDANIYAMVDIAEFYGVVLFKEYCDEYLSAIAITHFNIFKLMELAEKYSMIQLRDSTREYITNNFQSFVNSAEFSDVDKAFIEELAIAVTDKVKAEDLFQAIYKWTEKRAMDKQTADDLNDIIKNEIAGFLPLIQFHRMNVKFMIEFLVPHGFIFSSLDELSKILSTRILTAEVVKVTNNRGQTLHGDISDKNVIENIRSLQLSTCSHGGDSYCWWNTKFTHPSTPSSLKEKDGVEWYLVYYFDGLIAVFNHRHIGTYCYILAELTPGASGFDTVEGCKIEIE